MTVVDESEVSIFPTDFGVGCFILSLAIGVVAISQLTHRLHIPYTVLILCFGLLFGYVYDANSLSPTMEDSMHRWININPEIILFTMLPILIFESAFSTCVHTFEREFWQVFVLAGPGVLLSSGLTAVFARYCLPYDLDWFVCLMFGAMLSATDPVAVVALLKELGISERLATLIEGESLLNDGTSIVVFDVFLHAATSHQLSPASQIVSNGLRLSLGGPVIGLFVGGVGAWMIGYVVNNSQAETALTLVVCLGAFVLAEGTEIHVSGILSVVMAGLVFSYYGNSRISISAFHSVHSFWETCGYVANTVIFFISGLIMAVKAFDFQGHIGSKDLGYLILLYIALHVIRAITVTACFPVLYLKGYGITVKQAAVLAYGGLRGAVGLTLALIVEENAALEESVRARILFHTAGVAMLTLIINGTSMKSVLHYLHLDKSNRAETDVFIRACSVIEKKLDVEMSNLKRNPHLADADWLAVMRYIPVLTSRVYWHRIRHGTVELSKEELRDIVGLEYRNWWHSALNMISPGWNYSELPARLRSTWYHLHSSFLVEYGDKLATILEDHATNTNSKVLEHILNPVTVRLKGAIHTVSLVSQRLPRSRKPSFQSPAPASPADDRNREKSDENTVEKLCGLISPAPPTDPSKPTFPSPKTKKKTQAREINVEQMEQLLRKRPRRSSSSFGRSHSSGNDDDSDATSCSGMYFMERVSELRSEHERMICSVKRIESELNVACRELAAISVEPTTSYLSVPKQGNTKETLIFQSLTRDNASCMKSVRRRKENGKGDSKDDLLASQETRSDTDFLVSVLKPDQTEELHEARIRFMAAVKSNYLTLFCQGFVSSGILRSLKSNAEVQMDDETQPISCWTGLYRQFLVPQWVAKMANGMRSVPLLSSFLNRLLAKYITDLFDVTTTFITALESIKTIELIPKGPACNLLISEKVNQLKMANATLEHVLPAFPEIVRSLKTRTAARVLLTKHADICTDLAKQGFISEKEHEILVENNTKMRAYLASHPVSEHLPQLKSLARKVNFLRYLTEEEAEEIICNTSACHEEFHAANVNLLSKGNRISNINTNREGWYFIVRGCVCASDQVDYRESIKETSDFKQKLPYRIIHTGTPFGLRSSMLNLPFSDHYTTSSFVHALFFDKKEMLRIAKRRPALKRGIWLVVGVNLLYSHPDFRTIPLKSLYRILHYSFYVDSEIEDEKEMEKILKPRKRSSLPQISEYELTMMAQKESGRKPSHKPGIFSMMHGLSDSTIHPEAEESTPKSTRKKKSLSPSLLKMDFSGSGKLRPTSRGNSEPCIDDHEKILHGRAVNGDLVVEVQRGDLVFVLQGKVSKKMESGKTCIVTKMTPAYLWDLVGEVEFSPKSVAFIVPHEVLEWAHVEAHEYHADQHTQMSLDALHQTDIHRSRMNMTSAWSSSYYAPDHQLRQQMQQKKELESENKVAGATSNEEHRNSSYKVQRTGTEKNGLFVMVPHGPSAKSNRNSRASAFEAKMPMEEEAQTDPEDPLDVQSLSAHGDVASL